MLRLMGSNTSVYDELAEVVFAAEDWSGSERERSVALQHTIPWPKQKGGGADGLQLEAATQDVTVESHRSKAQTDKKQKKEKRKQRVEKVRQIPHTAFGASLIWGSLDPSKTDLGSLAPKILEAQREIPVNEVALVHTVRGAHDYYVRVLVWDPFRDLLVSGGGDGFIRLWSTQDYMSVGEIETRMSVRSLLVLTSELVSGHSNGDVALWKMDAPGWPMMQLMRAHKEAVYALTMVSSGNLISGAEDLRVFARRTLSEFVLTKIINLEVLCMCSIPLAKEAEGTVIATGDMNSLITVWDSANGWERVTECSGHKRSVWAVCYVRDVSRMASGSADQTIRIWDPVSWTCERVLKLHSGWVVGLCCGHQWLLSSSTDQTVRIWDCYTWTCERTLDDQEYEVYCVCAFSSGRFATGGADMSLIIYGGPAHRNMVKHHTHVEDVRGLPVVRHPVSFVEKTRTLPLPWQLGTPSHRPLSPTRQLRMHLVAQSSADLNMSNFRVQFVEPQLPKEDAANVMEWGKTGPLTPNLHELAEVHKAKPLQECSPSSHALNQQGASSVKLANVEHSQVNNECATDAHVEKPSGARYQLGDKVQCYSKTQSRWLEANVLKVEGDSITVVYAGANNSWAEKTLPADHEQLREAPEDDHVKDASLQVSAAECAHNMREARVEDSRTFSVGDKVECWSTTQGRWLEAVVTQVEHNTLTVTYEGTQGRKAEKTLPTLHEHVRPFHSSDDREALSPIVVTTPEVYEFGSPLD